MRKYEQIVFDYYADANRVTPEELRYASSVEMMIYAPRVRSCVDTYPAEHLHASVTELGANDKITHLTEERLHSMIPHVKSWKAVEEYGGNPLWYDYN